MPSPTLTYEATGLVVDFAGSGFSPNGAKVTLDFGDGNTAVVKVVLGGHLLGRHTYAVSGTYTATAKYATGPVVASTSVTV